LLCAIGNHEGYSDCDSALFASHLALCIQVRGFQVAPAELEGCLLTHPDVTNACVVGVSDDYSVYLCTYLLTILLRLLSIPGGEVPMAFVVLTPEAARQVEQDPSVAGRIKASIVKVRDIARGG